jgi:hypothetical protein
MNIKRGLLGGGTNGRKWVVEKLTGDEYDWSILYACVTIV